MLCQSQGDRRTAAVLVARSETLLTMMKISERKFEDTRICMRRHFLASQTHQVVYTSSVDATVADGTAAEWTAAEGAEAERPAAQSART